MSIHPSFSLSGRTALVTGSSRGIGASIAATLANAGASVVIHSAGADDQAASLIARITNSGGKATMLTGDFTLEPTAEMLVSNTGAALGPIDILVLNVAIQIPKIWTGISRGDCERQIAVNFLAPLRLLQLVVPGMAERRWGRVLTIGSVQETAPNPEMLVYSSLKNAQTGLIRSLAKQYAAQGVTFNNLAPGVIETDRYHERVKSPEQAAQVLSWIPAGYVGQPADCAGAALLLCSDAGRYITGQSLFVDGGMSL